MSALPNNVVAIAGKPEHTYFAEVDAFNTKLEQPLERTVERTPAHLTLDPQAGGYQYSPVSEYNIEGILSYKSGYTQVAGHPSSKVEGGFTTLATSVLEGLNILDVITADRVVAQISTVHAPFNEKNPIPVPSVTFLGTRFENLKIGGHAITIVPNLGILGHKPVGTVPFGDDRDIAAGISKQREEAAKQGLPDWAQASYRADRPLMNTKGGLECSVVNSIAGTPGHPFGNVIDLPHFGRIFLGELKVVRELSPNPSQSYDAYKFNLTMIRVEMGCLAKGAGQFAVASSNGKGTNGTGGP